MNFLRRLFTRESKPEFPNPREYWGCGGYEPYTWTQGDIDMAQAAGWTNIKIWEEDEYPYLKGVISGNDPGNRGNWYLPKLSSNNYWGVYVLEKVTIDTCGS